MRVEGGGSEGRFYAEVVFDEGWEQVILVLFCDGDKEPAFFSVGCFLCCGDHRTMNRVKS